MSRSLIIYASTSGSTKAVAETCAGFLSGTVMLFDLKTLNIAGATPPTDTFDTIIAGTPSYGAGDWHSNWKLHFDAVTPLLSSSNRVFLFALGDARGHKTTFAGGLKILSDRVAEAGIHTTGHTLARGYSYDHSPAEENGIFPGLVVEYRRDRHRSIQKVRHWLSDYALAEPPATASTDATQEYEGRMKSGLEV